MRKISTIKKLQFGTLNSKMENILEHLHELDRLYRSDSLTEYEKTWQTIAQQVQQTFPGFTIAYAEIYTAGEEREQHGGMRHVLLPQQE